MIEKKLYKVIQAMELGLLVKSNGTTFGLMENHNIGMQMSKVVGDGKPETVWHDPEMTLAHFWHFAVKPMSIEDYCVLMANLALQEMAGHKGKYKP